ncbi:MUTS family DNA-binding domain protein [Moumouvirus australiensis]|uniref:MUTS family DNA-binding domain protein n=1 Tax=Moumouvirus australiensis TaxID=2109587 RepID=A0A2P1EKH1_9VIRU|nr:MUTS family DNA-binding domain protein [Moumouvirus australiensis]YP_010789338.1 MUTS family DNA-binding domain protein [Moumouvirus australiensis]YP_010790218.1 MUTS family DNA-binding domain protein [Moumouvirus australiensis]AVL94389.1 MUTS family DNA-binding domain protein [Moumouvirus australiensis]AVL94404.1 MUTS family DNA-binding domain protein [Moumouvirus australiensis]AVL95285.1 MUTS family DNA-binding domain protein [Moumouvirus australiensis]
METIKPVKINKNYYYSSDELKEKCPIFFKGYRSSWMLINEGIIKKDCYIFAKCENGVWVKSTSQSKKFNKVFLLDSWVEKNIPEFNKSIEYEIAQAPDILRLKNKEKFKDEEGNIIDIEVRGNKNDTECYFLVKDVANGFDIKRLHNIIINSGSGYEIGVHYVYFNVQKYINYVKNANKKTVKKEIFLTYEGILKVLFSTRNNKTTRFVNWAKNILFTVQMGTKTQKNQLIASMTGVSPEAIKAVFSKTSSTLPCIYFYTIGKVKDLRKTLKISNDYDDEDIIGKYGMTKDLDRRTGEHNDTYGQLPGSDLRLTMFNFIDIQYLSQAESDLKLYMKDTGLKFNHNKYYELAIVSKSMFKSVKKQYDLIGKSYIGHIKELTDKIKEKDNEINLIKKDYDIMKMNHENELLKKDLEIMKMENKLLNKKLK